MGAQSPDVAKGSAHCLLGTKSDLLGVFCFTLVSGQDSSQLYNFSRQDSRMSGEGGQLAVHRVAVNSARYYRHRNIAATAQINRCCQMCLHPLFGGTQA